MQHDAYRNYKRAKRAFRNAHDKEYEIFIQSVYREIDEAAELDLRLFWRLIKQRRPRSSWFYPEICDATGESRTDPNEIANVFADFYENIYHYSENYSFDNDFKHVIHSMFDQIKINSVDKDHTFQISHDDVITATSSLKHRKPPVVDNITNKHILHSDNLIVECLCKLYNAIINIGFVPPQW